MDCLNVVTGRNKQVLFTGETIVVVDLGMDKRGRHERAHAVLDVVGHSLSGLVRPTDKLKQTNQQEGEIVTRQERKQTKERQTKGQKQPSKRQQGMKKQGSNRYKESNRTKK
jgi:hypothetical protein